MSAAFACVAFSLLATGQPAADETPNVETAAPAPAVAGEANLSEDSAWVHAWNSAAKKVESAASDYWKATQLSPAGQLVSRTSAEWTRLRSMDAETLARYIPAVDTVNKVAAQQDLQAPCNVIYVRFSKSFLAKYLCRQVDQKSPFKDNVLGASVVGTRHTVGETLLKLVESPKVARCELRFVGNNTFTSVAHQPPVQVHSNGITRFEADAAIEFDGKEVKSSKVVATAATKTNTTGITTDVGGLRERIVLRVAEREEAESHAQAEQITTDRTKARIAEEFSQRLKEGVDALTEELQTQFAKLPLEGRFAVREIRGSTTPEMMEIVLIGRGDEEPIYANAPHLLRDKPDIEIHVHAALVQKAILNPELRQTLQDAVTGLVDRPLRMLASAVRDKEKPDENEPAAKSEERQLKIRWADARGTDWFTLSWNENDEGTETAKPNDGAKKPAVPVSVTGVPKVSE